VRQRYMLAQDVPDVIRHAEEHWEWAVSGGNR
jgi:hypothetical protein